MTGPARLLIFGWGLSLATACGAERFSPSAGSGGAGGQGVPDADVGSGGTTSEGTGGFAAGGMGGDDGTGGSTGSGGAGGSSPIDAAMDLPVGTGGVMTTDGPIELAHDAGPVDAGDPCRPVRADGGTGGGCDCESFGGHAYRFCRTGRNFTAAESECVAHGMRLVRLDSDAENTWAYQTKVAKGMMTTWIGASDALAENDWRWMDGTAFWFGRGAAMGGTSVGGHYNDWDTTANEPNQTGDEDCAGYWYQIPTWADLTCTDSNAYICEAY